MAVGTLNLNLVRFSAPSSYKPLKVSFTTDSSHNGNPIYPATRLQLSFKASCGTEIFDPHGFSVKDIHSDASGNGVCSVAFPSSSVPQLRVPQGSDTSGEVTLYAWKGDRLIGNWAVGELENMSVWRD